MIPHQNPKLSLKDQNPPHSNFHQSSTSSTHSAVSGNMPTPVSVSPSGFFLFSLFFILFSANVINGSEPTLVPESNGTSVIGGEEAPMVPLIEAGKLEAMMLNESRRRLGSFRICSVCTCCGGAKGMCLATPCCYAINCNIPNRPFGFCSFTPQTCNCFGCHL